jgi:hypothetical protein
MQIDIFFLFAIKKMNFLSIQNDLIGSVSRFLDKDELQELAIVNRFSAHSIREAYKNLEFRKPIQLLNYVSLADPKWMRATLSAKKQFNYEKIGNKNFLSLQLQDFDYLSYLDIMFEYISKHNIDSINFKSTPKIIPTYEQFQKILDFIQYGKHKLYCFILLGLELNNEMCEQVLSIILPEGLCYIRVAPNLQITRSDTNL